MAVVATLPTTNAADAAEKARMAIIEAGSGSYPTIVRVNAVVAAGVWTITLENA